MPLDRTSQLDQDVFLLTNKGEKKSCLASQFFYWRVFLLYSLNVDIHKNVYQLLKSTVKIFAIPHNHKSRKYKTVGCLFS